MQHATSELMPIGRSSGDVIANVVFVHGLGGHNRETWQCDGRDANTFWPQWLYDDLNPDSDEMSRPVGVWSLGYPAEVFQVMFFSKGRDDSVPQRARNLVDVLVSHRLTERPIIFVSHSLGGVLVKQMLRSSKDAGNPRVSDFARLALSARLVIFLATPHTGSSIARLAETVPAVFTMVVSGLLSTVEWLPLGGVTKLLARRAIRRGRFTKALERGDPYLEDLAAWYRHNAPEIGIETKAYYENTRQRGIVTVVDKDSGNPGVTGVEAIAIDADHGSICKPEARNEHYRRIADPIQQAIRRCPVFKETHLAVLDVGERFERLAQLVPADRMSATKKVVQPIEVRLGRDISARPTEYELSGSGGGAFVAAPWQQATAATSHFDLDRIILNVWNEYRGGLPAADPAGAVRLETERLKVGLANHEELTLIPIYYAARAVLIQKGRGNLNLGDTDKAYVQGALNIVEALASKFDMDRDQSTRNTLAGLLQ